MTTGYPGRTSEHDLGGGHSFTWTEYGITESHLYGPVGGWHGWDVILAGTGWQVAGSPGDEEHLTVAVPLTCPLCGITGRIERGRWVPAGLRGPVRRVLERIPSATAVRAPHGDDRCPADHQFAVLITVVVGVPPDAIRPGCEDVPVQERDRRMMGPCTCSLQRGFRHPAQPAASQRRTGACYRALRCLPGRDFHPPAWTSLQDATLPAS